MSDQEKNILIVDDEFDICDVLREILEDFGYVVRVAHDGSEGLRVLKSASPKPSAVLLDLMMPVMDGNALYAAMREDPELASVPVIISTSDPARAPRGVPIVAKPVDLRLLMEAVDRSCAASGC